VRTPAHPGFRNDPVWRPAELASRTESSRYIRGVASDRHRRLGSRTLALAERRRSLVRLLIALFVARVVVTVTEIVESEVTLFSAIITAAIGLEAWRAWRVSRLASRDGGGEVELPDTVWNRLLLPLERRGPALLYILTAAYATAFVALLAAGESRDTLLDAAVISREIVTFFFLGVLVAGYLSVRPTMRDKHGRRGAQSRYPQSR
jgi:hypothetical protein